jgi:hypothetical protein
MMSSFRGVKELPVSAVLLCVLCTETLAFTTSYGVALATASRRHTGKPPPRPSNHNFDASPIVAVLLRFSIGSSAPSVILGPMWPTCVCVFKTSAASPSPSSPKRCLMQTRVFPRSLTFCADTATHAVRAYLKTFTCAPVAQIFGSFSSSARLKFVSCVWTIRIQYRF